MKTVQHIMGRDLMVFLDNNAIALATTCRFTITADVQKSATPSSGFWNDNLLAELSFEGSSDSLFVNDSNTANAHTELTKAMIAGTPLDITFGVVSNPSNFGVPEEGWTSPSNGCYKGQVLLTSIDINAPNGDGATMSVSFIGSGELQVIDPSGPTPDNFLKWAQINIHTKKSTRKDGTVDLWTVVEGVSEDDLLKMSDPSKYRLCLMRFRKGENGGRSWHISALPYFRAARTGKPIAPNAHGIAEEYTWWPVTGREVAWFRGVSILDVLPYEIGARNRFKNSKSLKMLDGVALFQYTGHGGEGWTRVSNIACVESFLARRNSTDPEKPPCVQISVKM